MSEPRPHGASSALLGAWRSALTLAVALGVTSGCEGGDDLLADHDGSFGRGVTEYPRDAGMDGGGSLDAGASASPLRIRFIHALVSLGPLHLCHDADGAGSAPALPLTSDGVLLRADFRERSSTLLLPPLVSGTLTLQHAPSTDAGIADAGPAELCDVSLREATIPLPQDAAWLQPAASLDAPDLPTPDVSPTLSGPGALTLIG